MLRKMDKVCVGFARDMNITAVGTAIEEDINQVVFFVFPFYVMLNSAPVLGGAAEAKSAEGNKFRHSPEWRIAVNVAP